jgi:hypothetical protein
VLPFRQPGVPDDEAVLVELEHGRKVAAAEADEARRKRLVALLGPRHLE